MRRASNLPHSPLYSFLESRWPASTRKEASLSSRSASRSSLELPPSRRVGGGAVNVAGAVGVAGAVDVVGTGKPVVRGEEGGRAGVRGGCTGLGGGEGDGGGFSGKFQASLANTASTLAVMARRVEGGAASAWGAIGGDDARAVDCEPDIERRSLFRGEGSSTRDAGWEGDGAGECSLPTVEGAVRGGVEWSDAGWRSASQVGWSRRKMRLWTPPAWHCGNRRALQ